MTYSPEKPVVGTIERCSICLGAAVLSPHAEQHICVIPHCGHCFHGQCIGAWLRSKLTCPNCNAELDGANTITLNTDFSTASTERPIYQQLREKIRDISRETIALEQKSTAAELEVKRKSLLDERDVLNVLERRNRLLAEIAGSGPRVGATVRGINGSSSLHGDKVMLAQLAQDLKDETQQYEAAVQTQQQRHGELSSSYEAALFELSRVRRLVDKKKRSLAAGQYEVLKTRAAERRQRSASAVDSAGANIARPRNNSSAAIGGARGAASRAEDNKKPRFGTTREERDIKNRRLNSWMAEIDQSYGNVANNTARRFQPSPIRDMECDFSAADDGDDASSVGGDHRTFAAKAAIQSTNSNGNKVRRATKAKQER